MATRAAVYKTYKLLIGGKFVRSESGRSYEVAGVRGEFIANVVRASRKDLRDAVLAARQAQPGWSAITAYNRGQILYRIAEMLENRQAEYRAELERSTEVSAQEAQEEIVASIDRWVYYAGWSDKFGALLSSLNPVAMPMHNFTVPEPVGVVGIVCPDEAPLLSLTSLLAPVIVSGNTAVVLVSERAPTPGMAFAEVLEVADLPAGVVNLLSGYRSELVPHLAGHVDVDALNLCGVQPSERAQYEVAAADSVKRLAHSPQLCRDEWRQDRAQGLEWIEPFLEMKTVWHPMGW